MERARTVSIVTDSYTNATKEKRKKNRELKTPIRSTRWNHRKIPVRCGWNLGRSGRRRSICTRVKR